ncbi:MAG: hypothetical protein WCO44_15440 [Bacteroidota bacterium]
MKKIYLLSLLMLSGALLSVQAQTVIPNPSFETWTTGSYSDPTGWDTPNQELMSIPFFGFSVVTKSTDHQGTGSFSAKLETKHLTLPPTDVPGFMTCGKLTVDITNGTYTLSGGVPCVDMPTHLMGFYKFVPKGGDSCVIGIGLTKTTGSAVDTVAYGSFSTKDTVPDWLPFSAWIKYVSTLTADTMNIIAMSTAQQVMTPGTALWVDNLFLDYTLGFQEKDPAAGIRVYNDRETSRLMVFFDFPRLQQTRVRLVSMTGQTVFMDDGGPVDKGRRVIPYGSLTQGIYLLEIEHDGMVFTKKYFLNLKS